MVIIIIRKLLKLALHHSRPPLRKPAAPFATMGCSNAKAAQTKAGTLTKAQVN